MSFASGLYLAFLAVVAVLHARLPLRARNAFLVAAGAVYCGSFGLWQGLLLVALTVFNWAWARRVVARTESGWALAGGIAVNLAPLVLFKSPRLARGSLPVGISFYTFQGIGYLVDVSLGEAPLHSLLDVALFTGLWSKLVAGPIVRLGELRDQLPAAARRLPAGAIGAASQRILVGLFKKVALADSLSPVVAAVFDQPAPVGAADAAVATLASSCQIYFDFAAYSDIAIGSALLVGFHLPENFDFPYGSRTPAEFWNRWHMTLSRWIRDYLYTPLSFGLRARPSLAPLAMIAAMTLCGLWHGAAWTFVAWGAFHGVLLALGQSRPGARLLAASRTGWRALVAGALTLTLVVAAVALFRAHSLAQAADVLGAMATLRAPTVASVRGPHETLLVLVVCGGTLVAQQIRAAFARAAGRDLDLQSLSPTVRWGLHLALAMVTLALGFGSGGFVYFQF